MTNRDKRTERSLPEEAKRVKWNVSNGTQSNDVQPTIHEWNHACIVKTYDLTVEERTETSIKLNDIIEFVGVLSVEPIVDQSSEVCDISMSSLVPLGKDRLA